MVFKKGDANPVPTSPLADDITIAPSGSVTRCIQMAGSSLHVVFYLLHVSFKLVLSGPPCRYTRPIDRSVFNQIEFNGFDA